MNNFSTAMNSTEKIPVREFKWVCMCDPQTQYECGGLGHTHCPYCQQVEVENLPADAYQSHPYSDPDMYHCPR